MRIAIDCRLWDQGGVGRYLRNLLFELAEIDRQNEYTLFFYQKPQIINQRWQTRVTQARWHSLSEQTSFAQELMREHFDLVHFPYFSFPLIYNRPFIITVHDLTIKHMATGRSTTLPPLVYRLKRLGYEAVLNQGIKRAQQILVPTAFVRDDILANYQVAKNKIIVTPEGVGREFKGIKPTQPHQHLAKFLLYVGNCYPHKNLEFLIDSLAKKPVGYPLVIYGAPDYFNQRLQGYVEQLNMRERVYFWSYKNEAKLAWLYSHAQALVLPSLAEGFGLPVVEAAYFNCPMLLSDIPAFKEIAPPGAIFFNPQDSASLNRALERLPERTKTDSAYFNRYSFTEMARSTLAVYQQVE